MEIYDKIYVTVKEWRYKINLKERESNENLGNLKN